MLLNQSMVLGVADIHDRYRDMRLDVDYMTYEVKPEQTHNHLFAHHTNCEYKICRSCCL